MSRRPRCSRTTTHIILCVFSYTENKNNIFRFVSQETLRIYCNFSTRSAHSNRYVFGRHHFRLVYFYTGKSNDCFFYSQQQLLSINRCQYDKINSTHLSWWIQFSRCTLIFQCLIEKEAVDWGISTMKMLCLLPLFLFQLILPCYTFGRIHDQVIRAISFFTLETVLQRQWQLLLSLYIYNNNIIYYVYIEMMLCGDWNGNVLFNFFSFLIIHTMIFMIFMRKYIWSLKLQLITDLKPLIIL